MNLMTRKAMREIPYEKYPFVVLADNRRSFFSRMIDLHTRGNYSHAMISRKPGFLVSQDGLLRERPMEDYERDYIRLKFYQKPDMTTEEKIEFNRIFDSLLTKVLRYDWLGIVGHMFGIRKLNFNSRYYCSEVVWVPFREIWGYKEIHPSPRDLDVILPLIGWEVYGIHEPMIL
jgi:hypothetical protein